MIVYRIKMQNGKIMWDAPPVKCRQSDKTARRDLRLKKYRRLSWWSIDRWNQRHGENSNTVQTDM